MKLLSEFREQVSQLGALKRVWLTSFNLSVKFIESHLLPIIVDMDPPKNLMDYESYQKELIDKSIDFKVFCDKRMMNSFDTKRTSINVYGVSPRSLEYFSEKSLFHPKVIYLEDIHGQAILGTGSANLTLSGWGRNQEVFTFLKVSTKEQLEDIKDFYKGFMEKPNLGLGKKRFWGKDKSWQFVHSFQEESFLTQLLMKKDKELAVWSPYFPRNLPSFIKNLKESSQCKDLVVRITPDLIDSKIIRTKWGDDLNQLVSTNQVVFYKNAVNKHQNTELCHAKIWQTSSKLAIGSWNFTGPGSNNLKDEQWESWSGLNNIEAGIIFKNKAELSKFLGDKLEVTSDNFSSEELLDDQALTVPEELPFDIKVFFDWQSQRYTFDGKWCQTANKKEYSIKLPDLKAFEIPSRKKGASLKLEAVILCSPQPIELLTQHTFDVLKGENVVHRGIIIETSISHRRVQGYDNLDELLDSLITNEDPENTSNSKPRGPSKPDDTLFEEDKLTPEVNKNGASYFKLFQATENFELNLKGINKFEHLEKLVFVYPGCLAELREKINVKINGSMPEVFNWFLAEEYNSLVNVAREEYQRLRSKGSATTPPVNKWKQLELESPLLPENLKSSKCYIKLIKKECNYD